MFRSIMVCKLLTHTMLIILKLGLGATCASRKNLSTHSVGLVTGENGMSVPWSARGVVSRNEEAGMCYVMPAACVLRSKHH